MNPMSAAFSMVAEDAAKAAGAKEFNKDRGAAFYYGGIAVRSDDDAKEVAVGAAAKSMMCPDHYDVLMKNGLTAHIEAGIHPGEGTVPSARITVNRLWLLRILRVMDSSSVTLAYPPEGGILRVGGTASVRISEGGERIEVPVAECIAPITYDENLPWKVRA